MTTDSTDGFTDGYEVTKNKLKIPGLTLTAMIILYVYAAFFSLSILVHAFDSSSPIMIFFDLITCGLLIGLSMGLVGEVRKGKIWARITVTVLFALPVAISILAPLLLHSFSTVESVVVNLLGIVSAFLFFGLPVIFLWLPRSNEWFKMVKNTKEKMKS